MDVGAMLGASTARAPRGPRADLFGAAPRPAAARRQVRAPASVNVVPSARSEFVNRCVNVLIAGVALLILAPVCVLVALAIKLTSPGPVFYTQTRVGLDRRWRRGADGESTTTGGRRTCAVARSRSSSSARCGPTPRRRAGGVGHQARPAHHAHRPDPAQVAARRDPAAHQRAARRDEHRGPAPERPSIVVRLCEHVHEYPQRHRVKPGITGWAQINHSYDASIEDVRTKVRYDLEYLARQSMAFDLKIMVMTLPVMLFKRGAH
jgi:lipopolysaccharide/colanic/teichoic acid biosynthesis glycosyltransferase